MDDLNSKITHAYNLKDAKIYKDRGFYNVTSKGITGIVSKLSCKTDHIIFIHKVKEYLYSCGFNNIDRFFLTTQELPYFLCDNTPYALSEKIKLPEADFTDNNAFINIVLSVSNMHKLMKGFSFEQDLPRIIEPYGDKYKKSLTALKKIKNRLSAERRLSDFDVLFLKNYSFYCARLGEAIKLISDTKLNEYMREAPYKGYFCHNLLKEENLLVKGDKVFITNFSECGIGYYIFDLESLVRRYAKNLPEKYLPLKDVINIYNKYNTLGVDEINILYSLLKYPDKFIKVCIQHYSKKRSFTPGIINIRMQNEINKKERYEAYIDELMATSK